MEQEIESSGKKRDNNFSDLDLYKLFLEEDS